MIFLSTNWTPVKCLIRWNLEVLHLMFILANNKIYLSLSHCVASPELLCSLHKESCSFCEKRNLMSYSGWMFIAMIKSFQISPQAFICLHQSWFFNFFSVSFLPFLPFSSIWHWTWILNLRLLRVKYFQLLLKKTLYFAWKNVSSDVFFKLQIICSVFAT